MVLVLFWLIILFVWLVFSHKYSIMASFDGMLAMCLCAFLPVKMSLCMIFCHCVLMYAEIVLDSRYFSNDTCAKLFSARPLRTCQGKIFSACPARALEDPVDARVVRRWMHHLGNHPISNQSSNQPPSHWVIYIFPHLLSLGSSATSKVLGRLWKIKRAEITHATLTERHSLKSTCVFFFNIF